MRVTLSCLVLLLQSPLRGAAAAPRSQWQALGQFEVVSGQVRISDPCYQKRGTSPMIAGVLPARKGTWLAAIRVSEEKDLGRRVAELLVLHQSRPAKLLWREASFFVGVDSGTAGVFDELHFRDDSVRRNQGKSANPARAPAKREPGEAWYEEYVVGMKGDAHIIPFGVITHSGFGDGSYRCRVSRSAGGQVEAIRIVYIAEGKEGDDLRAVVRRVFQRVR